jgi:hypothetical protein
MEKDNLTKLKHEFTIDRTKWGRGRLVDYDDRMCAMGHLAYSIGVTKDEMYGKGTPDMLHPRVRSKFGNLGFLGCDGTTARDNGVAGQIITANDTLNGEEREKRLKQVFSKIGIKVNFKG